MPGLLSLLAAYAIGCISFASLIARSRGIDIRQHGSGNPGATNVGRLLGKWWGRLVLVLDVLKGYLPVKLLPLVMAPPAVPASSVPPWLADGQGLTLLAAAVVVGHVFPVTALFRGGKGVATLIGALLALDPLLAAGALLVLVVVRRLSGYVSLSSVAMAWAFPLLQWLLPTLSLIEPRRGDGAGVMAGLALLVTLRHAANFGRIRAGTESRHGVPAQPKES